MSHLPLVLGLAARQHGSVAVAQLLALGVTVEQIRHMVATGQWIRVSVLVLRRAGTPRTRGQVLVEAAFNAGEHAAVSHLPAAAWWRVNLKPGGIDIMRERGISTTLADGVRLHEPRCFPEHHRRVFRGVPVTVPSRIPFDVAATAPSQAEKVLDRLWTKGLLGHQSVTAMLDELAERGRTGISLMRELLADRGPDYRPNDTNLEDRFQQLAREAGWTSLVRQYQLLGREWLGRVDFIDHRRKLVIEVNSALYHDALIDRRADADRRAAIEAAGYRVSTFTDTEVWFDPRGTIARLRALR